MIPGHFYNCLPTVFLLLAVLGLLRLCLLLLRSWGTQADVHLAVCGDPTECHP